MKRGVIVDQGVLSTVLGVLRGQLCVKLGLIWSKCARELQDFVFCVYFGVVLCFWFLCVLGVRSVLDCVGS